MERQKNIDILKRKDTTHKLSCIHALNGRTSIDYEMDCIILKKMPGHRLKILVFGERYWPGNDDKKRIRYVDEFRIRSI